MNFLQDFLLLEEIKPISYPKKNNKSESVILRNINVSWSDNAAEHVLRDISINIPAGKLYIISGPVGAGKSTLLKAILGELEPSSGELTVNGVVAYAGQEAWLFAGTVRSNILFGEEFDKSRYDKVIAACALVSDFDKLPNGDSTFVGERGSTLSGGQRARVNLARAAYRDANVYLIDDALASVDANVGGHIMDNCVNGFLEGKTRILITENSDYFEKADKIVILDNGRIDFCGSYKELTLSNYRLTTTRASIVEVEEPVVVVKTDENALELKFFKSEQAKVQISENQELTNETCCRDSVIWRYFRAGGSTFVLFSLVMSFILAQASVSGSAYWLAHWMKDQERYFKETYYSNNNNDAPFELKIALYVFAALLAISVIMWTTSSLLFYKICTNASKNLHNQMFSCLVRTPVYFFDLNPSGRILNRFSKDTGLVDETLPTVTLDAIQVLLMMAGVAIQVLIINWWSIIPMIAMGVTCWKFKNIYLPTAQIIRRLENKAKSPVFSHVNSTVSGLTTIRSAKTEDKFKIAFNNLQNVHTSAHHLNIVSSSAFGFWLDIVSVVLLVFIIFCFTFVSDSEIFAGIVGLAITQTLMLYGTVQYGLRQTTEMIMQMTSVERIFQFTSLQQEGPFETEKSLNNWPSKGEIVIEHLFLKYFNNEGPILQNITLRIKPKEKIGIVGRTGAGKTSLISALLRLLDFEGSIYIDDVDIKTVGLHELRKKISVIPQHPILFTTSVRANLDPLHQYSDDVLWQALEDVELKTQFDSLSYKIENEGNNLSTGQKQLFCLARAIIAKNKIFILDEATANIDSAMEEIIQRTIKQKFSDCTILTIAHRLNTVLNSDKILLIDEGKIVAFDEPSALMKYKNM